MPSWRQQGKKPRRPRDGRDPFAPKPTAQRNFTDPESKIMKTSDGSFHQCYNGQAIVDARGAGDRRGRALRPGARRRAAAAGAGAAWMRTSRRSGAELPEGAALTADAGYFSEENVKITTEHGLDPYIATGRFKHSEPPAPAPRGPIPKDATPKQRMARKLKTKKGTPFTPGARRSSSRCSARCKPSKTPSDCCYAASQPPAPNGASNARSTTSSSSTATADSPSWAPDKTHPRRSHTPRRPGPRGPTSPAAAGPAIHPGRSHAISADLHPSRPPPLNRDPRS